MDNERHAIETAPKGYFLADNGEAIKKSCEACTYISDERGDYAMYPYWVCDHVPSANNLPNFPFKNGCKQFFPHYIYTVDWEAEARKVEEESNLCKHLSHGKCFAHQKCEYAEDVTDDYPKCGKAPAAK